MNTSHNNQVDSSKTQNRPTTHMEMLESRQMMSATFIDPSSPTPHAGHESSAVSMSLNHSASQNSKGGGGALGTSAVGNLVSTSATNKGGAEPYVTEGGLRFSNFSNDPLFSSAGPSINDINQGAVGDCYFLSAVAEEAAHDPSRIRSLVRARGDGTFDVYLYHNGWVDEHVDGLLPVSSNGQLVYAGLGQGNSTWVALMEKAFCYFRASLHGQAASYGAIDTGSCAEGLGDLGLGVHGDYSQSSFSNGRSLAVYLYSELQQNQAVELMTSGVGGSMITQHAYAIISAYQDSAGNVYIEVRNPWGTKSPNGQPYTWVNANTVLSQMADVVVATA